MSAQLSLLPKPDLIQEEIERAQARGQRISPWVTHIMRVWEARNVKPPAATSVNPKGLTYLELGEVPIPCDCVHCKEPAVIFPPEDGSPYGGYCVCPCCSLNPNCQHKSVRAVA